MLYKNIEIYTNGQTDRRRNLLGVPAFVKAFAKAMELHSYLLLSLMKLFTRSLYLWNYLHTVCISEIEDRLRKKIEDLGERNVKHFPIFYL